MGRRNQLSLAAAIVVLGTSTANAQFHVQVGGGINSMGVDWIGAEDAVAAAAPEELTDLPDGVECPPEAAAVCGGPGAANQPQGFSTTVFEGTAGIGYGILTLEASLAMGLESVDYTHLAAGVRLDTGMGFFAFQFRFRYVKRFTEDFAGEGGGAGIGILVRPADWLTLYAEASAEATMLPDSVMAEMQILPVTFSYSGGGGLRIPFTL
jgi:hypothetical protein